MSKKPLNFVATLTMSMVLAAGTAFAGDPNKGHKDHDKNKDKTTAQTTQMTNKTELDKDSKDFVMKCAKGDLMEVEAGKLAKEKATNQEVKSFADMMVKDHTMASDEMMKLVGNKGTGFVIPKTLDKDQTKKLDSLRKEKDFDRKYMTMMISDHKDTIDLFENYVKTGKDADLKAHAEKTLPKLRQHLKHAQDTEARLDQMSQK